MQEAVKLCTVKDVVNWISVVDYMQDTRTTQQCMNRWKILQQQQVSKRVTGPWQIEEVCSSCIYCR